MSQKKYWKGLEELENTPEYQESVANEFNEELPLDLSDNLLNANTPRRDFLKFLGFSTLAATVAASCEMPVRKAIPYAIKPEDITPGIPNYYASTFVDNGECVPVVVKTVEGRPIMIEGNNLCQYTNGGSSARMVAATLGLYDKTRLRQPHVDGKGVDTFAELDGAITTALGSGPVYLLTSTIISPTTEQVIAQFLAKYPGGRHVVYDPISYSGLLLANGRSLPNYQFDKARTIVSIGADFLGSWLSPVEYNAGYAKGRRILGKDAKTATMSKHYQIEGMLSLTGANADERATCRPSEYGKVASALQAAVGGGSASTGNAKLDALINRAAADLRNGNGLVVCGSNDVNVQNTVRAINSSIGANGTTISSTPAKYKKGIDADMVALVQAMEAGQVGTLLMHGVNPVYDYFEGDKFAAALKKVRTTISFADRLDETAEKCKYVVPDHHWLESWGDAEPKAGYISFIQPTIAPLFKTRAFQDSLLKWAGATETYHDMFNAYWVGKLGQSNFDKALQDGLLQPATSTGTTGAGFVGNTTNTDTVNRVAPVAAATAAATIDTTSTTVAAAATPASNNTSGGYEVIVFPSVAIGHGGAWSNNPWLQETPDPITKVTWDSYVMMSPKTAKEHFDAELTSINQVDPKKRVVKIKVGNKEVSLPVVVTPGMHHNVVAIPVGYGRSKGVGLAAADLGKNVYPFVRFDGQTFIYSAPATIEKTADKYSVAITQTHNSAEARPIIHEYTLADFKKNPYELIEERYNAISHYLHAPDEAHHGGDHNPYGVGAAFDAKKFEDDFHRNGSHYPVHESLGLHWGMSIDMNTCTGCAACVVACQSENNVSVVGKDRVMKVQEMSWLKIDRYFSGDPNDPDSIQTVFQPMLCQHCDNAPCENVCPVSATNHSSEGMNQMAYNRCIGTKYCANNCPFKVRRFNWFDWNGADAFDSNLYTDGRRDDMNDDLTRMVLNPDVTVRSRGVMEKCSFCVQRLQDGKLHAKKENRPFRDGDAKTACQVACPTNAIVFGNVNDKESAIYKDRFTNNKERNFYLLEQIHVLPNVSYLSKIRNTDHVMTLSDKDEVYKQHI